MTSARPNLDLRLQEIRARLSHDLTLQQFLEVLDHWDFTFPISLGAVVGGQTVQGLLVGRTHFARHLDETIASRISHVLAAFDAAREDMSLDETLAERLRAMQAMHEDGFMAAITDGRRGRDGAIDKQLAERLDLSEGPSALRPPDVNDLPEELQNDFVQWAAQRTGFALGNARIFMPGSGWVDVGLMRVNTSQVGAWWLLDLDEDHEDDESGTDD